MTTTTNEMAKLETKMAKLAALMDAPRTPANEADTAERMWWVVAGKLRRMQLGK